MIRITLFLFCWALLMSAMTSAEQIPQERSPGDMSVEERRQMMEHASKYDNCVYSQAMTKLSAHEDIRAVADDALGNCQAKLEDLENLITSWGMPSGYAESFSARIRQRATRKLLPELAIRKAGG